MHGAFVRGLRRLPTPLKKALKRVPGLDSAARRVYDAAGSQAVRVEPGGFLMHLDLRSSTQRAYATTAPSESYVVRHLQKVLRPGDHVADVGGYVGYFTMLAASLVGPEGRVVTFEPVRDNAETIRRSAEANGFAHVSVAEVALSDRDGAGTMSIEREEGGSPSSTSSLGGAGAETLDVPVATLDEYVRREGIARLDLVKVDVEGLEREVVAGMEAVMRELRPELVIEFGSRAAATDCLALIESRSYDARELGRTRHGIHVSATPRG